VNTLSRYAAVGVVNTAIGFGIIFGLMALGFDATFAHGSGYGVGLIVSFVLNRRFTFRSTGDPMSQGAGFLLAYAIAYSLSLGALNGLQTRLALNAYLAQIGAAVVFFGVFYLLNRLVVFRDTLVLPEPLASLVARAREPKVGLLALVVATIELLRDARIGRILLAGVVVLILLMDFGALKTFYRSADQRAAVPVYNRVEDWIASARCFKESAVILAVCKESGGFVPIEDVATADDVGAGLLLGILHRWFAVPATKQALVFIHLVTTIVAVGLLSWQLVRLRCVIAAILFGGITLSRVSLVYFNSDVFSTYFGLFALSLLLPAQLLRMLSQETHRMSEWVWLALSGAAMVFVILVREPFGFIGMVATGLAMAVGLGRRRHELRIAHLVTATATLLIIVMTTNAALVLTEYRVYVQGVPLGGGIISHGISHNLYIGLGSDPNPFGIEWSDTAGAEAVKAIDPTIPYGSPRYFEVLRKLYFDAVIEHPLEVARIYAARASRVLAPFILPVLCVALAAIVAASSLRRTQGSARCYETVVIDLSVVTAIATLLHAAQAILTVAVSSYYFQADLGLYLLAAIACDSWYRIVWGNPL
jgi:putative flippase GtrA